MATRIQAMVLGMGVKKQTNITTIADPTSFVRMRKTDAGVYFSDFMTEDDAAEIGKGSEFATQVYPTNWDLMGDIQKFGSNEFVTWCWAYALGNVTYAAPTYTIVPINANTTIELPYFPIAVGLQEGGSATQANNLYTGCMLGNVTTNFSSGTGRKTVTTSATFHGSGIVTPSLSGVTIPSTVLSEHYMLSPSMSATILTTNYVTTGNLISGSLTWNNNPLLDLGYYPGSQIQSITVGSTPSLYSSVRGRIECGARSAGFTFEARLRNNSPEYAALVSQQTGTVAITLTFGSAVSGSVPSITWTWEQVSYKAVRIADQSGIATVQVTASLQDSGTNGVVSISSTCPGLANIAQ